MSHPDPEKLLGGYATGTLTEEEKHILFSAALEHQEIFNALADEEALRELLADPENRRHLLKLLPAPKPVPLHRWWQRPAVLGLAASLFAFVTISLVVWKRNETTRSLQAEFYKVQQEMSTSPHDKAKWKEYVQQAPPQSPTQKVQASPSNQAPEQAPAVLPAPYPVVAPPAMCPAPPPPPSMPTPSMPTASMTPPIDRARKPAPSPPEPHYAASADHERLEVAREATNRQKEAKKASLDRSQAEAATKAGSSPRAMDKPELPLATNVAQGAASKPKLSPGAVKREEKQPAKESPLALSGSVASTPTPTSFLEHLSGGRARLTVNWPSQKHLYVLKRTASGTVLLSPATSKPASENTMITTFQFVLNEKDIVDVYVMNQSVDLPLHLPATGPIMGYRKRVCPTID